MLLRTGSLQQVVFFTGQRGAGRRSARRPAAVELQPRVEQHREHRDADRARQSRVLLVGLRHRRGAASRSRRPATSRRRSEVYFTREMRNHHASSVLVGDHLYGFSSSILTALQFDTGELAWRDRSVGKGSLIYADERLYLYSEDGVVGLAEASPDRVSRARAGFSIADRRTADVEPSDHHQRTADHSRSGQRLRVRCGAKAVGIDDCRVGNQAIGRTASHFERLVCPARVVPADEGGTILLMRM